MWALAGVVAAVLVGCYAVVLAIVTDNLFSSG